MSHGLGRLPSPDQRDNAYPVLTLLGAAEPLTTTITKRVWYANGWWGDQGSKPQCVGYGWAHWIEDGPVTHAGVAPVVKPALIYNEAQKVDEWPGPPPAYDGTSVRAGAKFLQAAGWIESYHWAFDLETTIQALLNLGPVVVGTNWYESMFKPDAAGYLKITGDVAGGHCYVIDAVNLIYKRVRMKQSWGRLWGNNGFAYIRFADLERLINEGGEVCIAVEKHR